MKRTTTVATPAISSIVCSAEAPRTPGLGSPPSLGELLPYAVALFEPTASEPAALSDGVADRPSAAMETAWRAEVEAALSAHDVTLPWPAPVEGQAARTARSPDFDDLLADLTVVFRLDPDAVW